MKYFNINDCVCVSETDVGDKIVEGGPRVKRRDAWRGSLPDSAYRSVLCRAAPFRSIRSVPFGLGPRSSVPIFALRASVQPFNRAAAASIAQPPKREALF